jgi:hypothetical protein
MLLRKLFIFSRLFFLVALTFKNAPGVWQLSQGEAVSRRPPLAVPPHPQPIDFTVFALEGPKLLGCFDKDLRFWFWLRP